MGAAGEVHGNLCEGTGMVEDAGRERMDTTGEGTGMVEDAGERRPGISCRVGASIRWGLESLRRRCPKT